MPSIDGVAKSAVDLVQNTIWTTVYFVYFLFKGKSEWKCEPVQPQPVKYCCIDGTSCNDHSSVRQRKNLTINQSYDNHNSIPKSFNSSSSSTWNYICLKFNQAKRFLCGLSRRFIAFLLSILTFCWNFLWCILSVLKTLLFSSNVPSQSLPATPKPFTPKPSSPSYNKVEFEFNDEMINDNNKRKPIEDYEPKEDVHQDSAPSESFYTERVYEPPPTVPEEPIREPSAPPPPPPPPPPPVPPKPVSREPSRARSMTPGRREIRGGIGGFNEDIMGELEEQQRLRNERQREMTQSCHPDMAQWKQDKERFAGSTPYRASSVGPTMRRLEQVVRRIDGEEEDEPSFIFKPKIVHSSEEYQRHNQPYNQQNDFLMGRSVFSPVYEAEQMRNDINSKQQTYQKPNMIETQSVRTQRYDDGSNEVRNPFGSAAYKASPYASHTARRSKTPNRFDAGCDQSGVESIARQWPPASNATGAVASDGSRDEWVQRSMRYNDPAASNDDGLVTTMCRRVIEKKRQDNWKTKDHNGRLLDERSENQWKGELDTLLRDGPNEGRHWSRTVEKLPTGDTRFQDVNRQYTQDFVVESVVRNY